jgi:hypothetical protein
MGTMRVRVVPFVQKLRVGRETPPVISRTVLFKKKGAFLATILRQKP